MYNGTEITTKGDSMKIFIILACVFIGSQWAIATTIGEAEKTASGYLKAEVRLDQQSPWSYFFITGLEGDDEFPCIRGVVVNKQSGKIVAPNSDAEIKIDFSYSDTRIEDLTVVNCAD